MAVQSTNPEIIEGLVSVVIPVFNRSFLVAEAVNSVFGQSYPNVEIILVDDGSTDSTPQVLEEIASKARYPVTIQRISNSGPALAREAGRQLARGEYIQYLDSDDLLLPEKFKLQVDALEKNPKCVAAYGKTIFEKMGTPRVAVAYRKTGENLTQLMPAMLSGRWWCTNTPLYRRNACDVIGPWSDLRMEEDWEYDCRMAQYCNLVVNVNEFVSVQRAHDFGHACHGANSVPALLLDRCKARERILGIAIEMGYGPRNGEFRSFVNESFLVARQADKVGVSESGSLLRKLSKVTHTPKLPLYRIVRAVIGGRLASLSFDQTHHFLGNKSQLN